MTKPQSELGKYLLSKAFMEDANRAVQKAIAEAEAAGLPRAYKERPFGSEAGAQNEHDQQPSGHPDCR